MVEDCSNLLWSDPYWLPHVRYRRTYGLQGEGRLVQPYSCSTVIIPCEFGPFLHFSPNGRRSVAGGCSSSVWNVTCCSCTAVLTHDPFEIRFRSPPQLCGCADTRSIWDQVRTVLLNYTSETARVSPPEVRYIYPKFWRSLPRKRIGDYTKRHDRRISMTKTSLLFARPVFDHFSRWHLHHTHANILRLYISANSFPTQFKMWAVIKYVNTCVMFSHYQLVDMDHPAK